ENDYAGIVVGENGFILLNGGGPAFASGGNQGKLIFQQGNPTNPSLRRVQSFVSNQVSAGVYHHVLVTKNNSLADFFIDGVKVASQPVDNTIPNPVGNLLWFGRNTFDSPEWYFDGKLDDIGVWNRALTTTEISQLFSAGDPVATPGGGLNFVSSISTGAGGTPLKGLSEVRVAGNYAFAVSYYNTSFEVFNVANPAQPVHVAVLRSGDGGAVLSEPIGMDVQGDFAYVNNNLGSVEVIDISDPTKPKHAATVLDGQGGAVLKDLYGGIRVRGNYLYIVGRGAAVLEIIDISDPYKPFHAGLLNNGSGGASLANPYDLDFKDDFLFVTSYDANALEVLDISNPVSPKHVSTLFNGTGGAVLTRPHNVKVLGNLAYITNYYDNNLEIIDVSDPANPVHAGNFSSYPGFGTLLTPHGIDAVGRYHTLVAVGTSLRRREK
ncbi:MAG: LamG-like jellyroll fold domain-containing protein, partial [Bacteroidota bacterium]